MNDIKILYFDVSEGIDVNKTSTSKECDVSHYWCFLNKGFKFQPYLCNIYHNSLIISMNLSYIAILKIKNVDGCCIITRISKREAINILQNIYLTKKGGAISIL